MYDGTVDETNQTEITLGCQFVRLPKNTFLKKFLIAPSHGFEQHEKTQPLCKITVLSYMPLITTFTSNWTFLHKPN